MFKNIPSHWELKELGELLKYEQPTKYIVERTDYNNDYKTPVLTAGKSFILGYTNEERGILTDVPVIIFDDFTTESKYVDFPFKVKSSAMKILNCKNKISLKYLYYLMQEMPDIKTTHKRYWISEYSKIKVPIPKRLEEQEEIVKILDDAAEMVRLRKECIDNTEDLTPAVFHQMFGNNQFNAVRIGSVTTDTKQSNPNKLFDNSFYYVDIASINNDSGTIEAPKYLSVKEAPSRARKTIQADDILVSMTRPYLRGFAKVSKELDGQIASTGFCVLRSKTDQILPEYLFAYIRTGLFLDQLTPKMKGATYPAVRDNDVREVMITLPSLSKQEEFVQIAREIDNYKKQQYQELKYAEELFHSLLQRAFTGELTAKKVY